MDITFAVPHDHARVIDIDESWARGFWSQRLAATETQLVEAVRAVGTLVVDVTRYLRKD